MRSVLRRTFKIFKHSHLSTEEGPSIKRTNLLLLPDMQDASSVKDSLN